MKAALCIVALVALVAVANGQAAAAAPKAAMAAPVAPKGAATTTRYCHQSCYNATDCKAALATKLKLLTQSKVPFVVEKQGCGFTSIGCNAIIRYSFANEAAHDQYQTMEKKDPAFVAAYKKAGLVSAAPKGLLKNGTCATLKSF